MKKIIFVFMTSLLMFSCSKNTDFKGVAYVTFGGGDVKPIAGNMIYLINQKTKSSIDSIKKEMNEGLQLASADSFNKKLDSLKIIVDKFNKLQSEVFLNRIIVESDFQKSLFEIKKGKIIICSPKYYTDFSISLNIYLSNKPYYETTELNDI